MKLKELKNAWEYLKEEFERFMVSQAGLVIKDGKLLIVEFSDTKKWGFPGGRVDKFEDGEVGFKRELKEELGLESFDVLGVVDYDIFYTPKRKRAVCTIANLIDCDISEIKLSYEHSNYKWIGEHEIESIDFKFSNAKRMSKKGFKLKRLLEKNEK